MFKDDDESKAGKNDCLSKLTDREKQILEEKFGIKADKNSSLAELEKQLQLIRENIEAIEQKALEKLNKAGNPDDAA